MGLVHRTTKPHLTCNIKSVRLDNNSCYNSVHFVRTTFKTSLKFGKWNKIVILMLEQDILENHSVSILGISTATEFCSDKWKIRKTNYECMHVWPMCIILHQAAFVFSAADLVPVNKIAKLPRICFEFKTNFDKCGYWILLRQMKDWEKISYECTFDQCASFCTSSICVFCSRLFSILHLSEQNSVATPLKIGLEIKAYVPVYKIAIFVAKSYLV